MTNPLFVNICAIGAGSGGLAISRRAVRMGASAALVEKDRMGGDCLNYGCVPSKAILAAGHAAQMAKRLAQFGVRTGRPVAVAADVFKHVHDVIQSIEPHDSAERYRGLGVTVIKGEASFVDPNELAVGDQRIRARRFVIATGSVPAIPRIEGLESVPYFTNETIFYSEVLPRHLLILGGGAIGVEMAQAYQNLGCSVTVLEKDRILQRDDPELVEILRQSLITEGVDLKEAVNVTRIEKSSAGIVVRYLAGGVRQEVTGSHLLVATGRRAFVDGLNLERAGVEYDAQKLVVDERLRTTNKRIYAVGDVTGSFQYAHMAGYQASIVLQNALLGMRAKVSYRAVPWVVFTDPELAHVGLNEAQARSAHGDVRVYRWPFMDNDRARAERSTTGMAKIVTRVSGEVIGATIVGPKAGELIQMWILMIHKRLRLSDISDAIFPYPTLGYVNKYVAELAAAPRLYGDTVKERVRRHARTP